jgi:hypothetical protein
MNQNVTAHRKLSRLNCAHIAIFVIVIVLLAHTPKGGAAQVVQPSADGDGLGVQASSQVPLDIVIARHVILLDGREIITWASLAEHIASLPDPSLAHPSFYFTRGAREADKWAAAEDEIWKLRQKFPLQGHSVGSLWAQADMRYDEIKNADDLKPDEALRLEGAILNEDGQPVAEAEVLLITPIDQSIPYTTWHIALVHGRVRNRLEHEMAISDATGRFALYPPKDAAYYIVALHPDAGFGLFSSDEIRSTPRHEARLSPWAGLIAKLEKELGEDHEASINTTIPAREGFPDVVIDQYWSDQKSDLPADFFGFTHVPPSFETALSHAVPEGEGESISIPGAKVTLRPGEIRRLDVGPLTDEQREQLKIIRRNLRERRG